MKIKNIKVLSGFYNLLLLFIILTLIYLIYKFYKENTLYSEFLCIGAGVSSAYACYEINKNNINRDNIIVLEKSDNYGGRIESIYSNMVKQNNHEVSYDELGAMRLFDIKSMKKIFDLLKLFGLKTIKVSLEDSQNIFYYNGNKYLKSDAYLSNGIKVSQFEEYVTKNLKNTHPELNLDDIFDYEEFKNMNITQFFEKYGHVGKEDINMWIAYGGYNYNLDNTQISTWLFEKNFFNNVDKDKQYYVLDGMISLVKKLFDNSNAKIVYNTKAISIEKDLYGYNIITTINSKHEYKKYMCKHLFIGLSSKQLQELNTYKPIPIDPLRLEAAYQSISVPLFKVFMKWDKEKIWWGKGKKYNAGKSTTDLLIRQVHYYTDEDILVYNTGKYAREIYNKFMENPANASLEVYEQIKLIHQMDIPPPNFAYTIFKYWPDGAHTWLIGADINKNVKIIPNGSSDKSNIFIVGDAFSKYQGWIIGGFDSVDIALQSFKK
jgi:monoamine oxidase